MGRRAVLAILGVLALAACEGGASSGSGGGCAAPWLEVQPAQVRAGDEVVITAEGMQHGCADHMGVDEHGNQYREDVRPMTGIELRLGADGAEQVLLTTVDADEHGTFSVTVTVPEDLPAGPASVSADVRFAEEAALEIVP